MKTIRRLYFYAVTAISVEVVAWGMIALLRSMFNPDQIIEGASTLAQALSLIFVGVPIFLFHWVWAHRASTADEEEKTASIRAVFLYGILLGTLIPAAQNFLALIDRIFLSAADLYTFRAIVGGGQTWTDNLIAIAVNLLLAAYFWNILKTEWRELPDTQNFTEVRRLSRFLWVLYGLMMIVYGAQQALDYAFTFSTATMLGLVGRETIVNAIALLVVGSPIWFFSWRILQDALADSAEQNSYLRLGILYLLSLGGVITLLTAAGNLIYLVLMYLLEGEQPLVDFLQAIGAPISIGLPFGVIWAYYGKWLDRQFAFDENPSRRAGKRRLYFYILSLLGLGASFFAVSMLVSVVIDLSVSGGHLSIDLIAPSLSNAVAALAAGLPLWLATWRPMQAEALLEGSDGDHARRSVIRKTYLYVVLFAAVIGGMASAGSLIFVLVNTALGGNTENFTKVSLNSLQVLVLFVILLQYHLLALRKDSAGHASALENRQEHFHLLVLDDKDGTFGTEVKAAFAKRAPAIPLTIISAEGEIPADLKADAVVLPASVAVNPRKDVSDWIQSFGGNRLIVSDEADGMLWLNDPGQAADSIKQLAEGQEIHPRRTSRRNSVWTNIAYVFAGLFACQLLFGLLMMGFSLATGF